MSLCLCFCLQFENSNDVGELSKPLQAAYVSLRTPLRHTALLNPKAEQHHAGCYEAAAAGLVAVATAVPVLVTRLAVYWLCLHDSSSRERRSESVCARIVLLPATAFELKAVVQHVLPAMG